MSATPPAQRLLLENRSVRVWEMVVQPGETYPMHDHHHPYLSVILEPASLVLIGPDGHEEAVEARYGDTLWRVPPERHAVRNVGATAFRNRLVELLTPFSNRQRAATRGGGGPAHTRRRSIRV